MSVIWLIILVCYGLSQGWDEIPALAWWLVLPFVVQDAHDSTNRERLAAAMKRIGLER